MGEAKRRVRCIGEFGDHAGDPRLLAATTRAIEALLPVIEELAGAEGNWAAVLNALNTITINLQIEIVGPAETERTLRAILRDLPSAIAQKRFLAAGGGPVGLPQGRA